MTDYLINGDEASKVAIILAHGAGAAMDTPFMNFYAEGLAESGCCVVRFEFPYMAQRRSNGTKRGPDSAKVLEQSWREVVDDVSAPRRIVGGKSMGGRVASRIADSVAADGLLCLGYPFHPPGKPEKLRTDHLRKLKTSTLIVQGTRDTFGKREEVADYSLSRSISIHWLEDGDHSFKPRKASGRTEAQNWQEGLEAAAEFVRSIVG